MGPILAAISAHVSELRPILVHTGQHYDELMSGSFFRELRLPAPDVHLGSGSGSQAEQTAKVLTRYEAWLLSCEKRPAATLVVGDVNSTLACALASVKLGIPVVHVEAGLRSFDRTMPEEINRVLTDAISDLLLVSEPSGVVNLRAEGRPEKAIKLVGNVMIDTLLEELPAARQLQHQETFGLDGADFVLWTMHRPANVGEPAALGKWLSTMQRIAKAIPVIVPVHPRTRARIDALGIRVNRESCEQLLLSPPLGYRECLSLACRAKLVITDSGGLQEESSALAIPCLTLRKNTERPITVTEGTSTLVGSDAGLLERLVNDVLAGQYKRGNPIHLWDGRAAARITEELLRFVAAT